MKKAQKFPASQNLGIDSWEKALKFAKEYELDIGNFYNRYGKGAVVQIADFFKSEFSKENPEKGKKFYDKVIANPPHYDFFGALDYFDKLPREFNYILAAKRSGLKKARVVVMLRGLVADNSLMPLEILPKGTHIKPLFERIEIVNAAYNWALKNCPLQTLESHLKRRFEDSHNQEYSISLASGIKDLREFISEKKRFMSRQRLRQRQMRVKKGEGSLKPKRSLKR